jgi:hypothetical protein
MHYSEFESRVEVLSTRKKIIILEDLNLTINKKKKHEEEMKKSEVNIDLATRQIFVKCHLLTKLCVVIYFIKFMWF